MINVSFPLWQISYGENRIYAVVPPAINRFDIKPIQIKDAEDVTVFDDALRKATTGNDAGTRKALAPLMASPNEGSRATAMLIDAALLLQKRDLDGAAKLYGQIAKDKDIPEPWRDLALVRQTSVQYDRLAPDEVITRLSPLAIKRNPWFGSAGEMVAIAYLKKNRVQPAAKLFADIAADPKVPESIRGRAKTMSASLNARLAVPAEQGQAK